jgi:hypothetical protein
MSAFAVARFPLIFAHDERSLMPGRIIPIEVGSMVDADRRVTDSLGKATMLSSVGTPSRGENARVATRSPASTASASTRVDMRPRIDDGHVRTIDTCGDTRFRTDEGQVITTALSMRADARA